MYKPVDEPHCGYDGGKCPRAKGNTEVAAGVLGGKLIKAEMIKMVLGFGNIETYIYI